MPAGQVNITVEDGSLGLIAQSNASRALIGTSSTGTLSSVYAFNDTKSARTALGAGPLLEEVIQELEVAGGPVYAVRANGSTAGTALGAWVLTGTGPAAGVGESGAPLADFDVVVKVVSGGALGTATVQISVDGGDTFTPTYTAAATLAQLAASTGLTFTMAVGTYVAGDTYTRSFAGPRYTAADLNAGLDAIRNYIADIRWVHVIGTAGASADPAATQLTTFVALCAAVDVKMVAAFNAKKPMFAIMEVPDVPDADITAHAAFNAQTSTRQMWVAGTVERIVNPGGHSQKRHAAGVVSTKLATVGVGQSPGVPADGTLVGVTRLYRDETLAAVSLDDLRVTTLRTLPLYPGYFVTTGQMRAAIGSDFRYVVSRRVMDEAISQTVKVMTPKLNKSVRVNPTGHAQAGGIDDRDAQPIDAQLSTAMSIALINTGQASGAFAQVTRGTNILSTGTIETSVRITPLGYARAIEASIGFFNPALVSG